MNDDIQATIDAYRDAWNQMDFAALASLWDRDEQDVYYVAEEVDKPFHRFADIIAYWERTKATVEWVRVSLSDRRARQLSDTLAVVTYEMHVDASMRGYQRQGFKPVGADVRVSAILRNNDGAWRFIHYVEAPLGALPFIRRVYNANVR